MVGHGKYYFYSSLRRSVCCRFWLALSIDLVWVHGASGCYFGTGLALGILHPEQVGVHDSKEAQATSELRLQLFKLLYVSSDAKATFRAFCFSGGICISYYFNRGKYLGSLCGVVL